MTLTRLALTLALGCIAANLYMKSRRQAYTMTTEPAEDGTAPWRETSPADPQTASGSDDSDFMPQTTSSLAASNSLNGAERLEEAGLAETPSAGQGSDMLVPASTDGTGGTSGMDGIKPGLSDFARGA